MKTITMLGLVLSLASWGHAATPTVTQTPTPTTTANLAAMLTFPPTVTPLGTVTPLACTGAGALANADMEAPAVSGLGWGAYLGTWHSTGFMEPGLGRSGSQALHLASAGGYMTYTSVALQDLCVDTACSGSFCVWTDGHGGQATLQQLDAGGNVLAQRHQSIAESSGWQQTCVAVGDGAFPWLPAAVALRVRLVPRLIYDTYSSTRFDDASYSAGACGTPTATVTPSATPSPNPTLATSVTAVAPLAGEAYAYPNPATGRVSFAMESPGPGEAVVDVLNSAGMAVARLTQRIHAGINSVPMELDSYATGMYFFQVRIGLDDGGSVSLPAKSFLISQ